MEVMLRITTHETESSIEMRLEGRVAELWADELSRVWAKTAPRLGSKKPSIDMRSVTHVDEAGKRVLKNIFFHSGAELVASSLETQDLAGEILQK